MKKLERNGDNGSGGYVDTWPSQSLRSRSRSRSRSFTGSGGPIKPSWLLVSIDDMEERMKMLVSKTINQQDNAGDTFAERAEFYYRKCPQLLALLQDLYNCYISLANRYSKALSKQNRNHNNNSSDDEEGEVENCSIVGGPGPGGGANYYTDHSDAESSLSYQRPAFSTNKEPDPDDVVAELVMKSVEFDIVVDEVGCVERKWGESSRKIELQRSLLEVLESERVILANENARLGYRVRVLVEENKGLTLEAMLLKRKAGELARRCVLKMRGADHEDHRVCMLSHKIEDLQGQIYGLEKTNKEYYEKLVKQEEEKKNNKKKKSINNYNIKRLIMKNSGKNGDEVALEDCFHVEEEEEVSGSVSTTSNSSTSLAHTIRGREPTYRGRGAGGGSGRKVFELWDRVKKFDMFMCGPHSKFTCC